MKFIVAALLYKTNRPKLVERYIPTVERPSKFNGKMGKTHVVRPPKGKLLYIVRHPVDVCVSGINHVAMPTGSTDVGKYVEKFVKTGGNTIGGFGTWDDGVRNWTAKPHCFWLRYEDLLNDTSGNILAIAGFVGPGVRDLDYAIKATTFKAMRSLEKKGVSKTKHNVPDVFYNPKHKGYKKGRMFINKGKAGYAREVISDAQIKRICERFGKTMETVGYAAVY